MGKNNKLFELEGIKLSDEAIQEIRFFQNFDFQMIKGHCSFLDDLVNDYAIRSADETLGEERRILDIIFNLARIRQFLKSFCPISENL